MKKKKLKEHKISEEILKDVEIIRDFFRLHESDEAKKIQCVNQLQSLAFYILRDAITEYLRPVTAKVPRSFSDNNPLKKLQEMYTVEKILLEWKPSTVEVFRFCDKAGNAGLSGSQHSAAWMLYFCTDAIEKNAVPDYVQDRILDAFAGLDDDVVAGWEKHGMLTQAGRNKGGINTKANKKSHKIHIESTVVERLKWTGSRIADHLIKHGLDTHEGRAIQKRQLLNYIKEIKAEHSHCQPTIQAVFKKYVKAG